MNAPAANLINHCQQKQQSAPRCSIPCLHDSQSDSQCIQTVIACKAIILKESLINSVIHVLPSAMYKEVQVPREDREKVRSRSDRETGLGHVRSGQRSNLLLWNQAIRDCFVTPFIDNCSMRYLPPPYPCSRRNDGLISACPGNKWPVITTEVISRP